MDEKQMDALTHRLDRLERENRWWKMVGKGPADRPRVHLSCPASRILVC